MCYYTNLELLRRCTNREYEKQPHIKQEGFPWLLRNCSIQHQGQLRAVEATKQAEKLCIMSATNGSRKN